MEKQQQTAYIRPQLLKNWKTEPWKEMFILEKLTIEIHIKYRCA